MTTLDIKNFITDKVKIEFIEETIEKVKLDFIGELDFENPESVVFPFFNEIHNKVISNKVKCVEVDFTKLEFLNSSGLKTLIKWIKTDITLPEDNRYKFKIIATSKIHWQENALKVLPMLSPLLIEIKII
ncbi:MAG: hypothetical protein A2086_05425 [Spirochaetes bacterium GWD1_27_9]|nr:MAG: hypothetical protein A2Z98_15880 [Spirochaetes bacterium GWB1_27_13]OHD26134.1 MAG: hypothetical protein A2Y34_07170 [Spirochaetes bacterium GWC1_27_15]OHD31818.1 MAG: hypothetical protein A2086_05425 [Spirochaetes bacterium GWD1_27_9]